MDERELVTRIARANAAAPRDLEQVRLLMELAAVYQSAGFLPDGQLPSLERVCPHSASCWRAVPEEQRPTGTDKLDPASSKGCIVLPWVGPLYRPGGVCVLGMNLRYNRGPWKFGTEHEIATNSESGQLVRLRAGKRSHGSNWAYATMTDVAAVLRSRRGDAREDRPGREERAQALLESARLQAVKCSPSGGRSSPTGEMNRNCPPQFLKKELEVLRPSALLAYGRPTHGALFELGGLVVEEDVAASGFRRAALRVGVDGISVFLMTHPASAGWHRSRRELVASLKRRPVSSDGAEETT